jgi:hypothetical protein
MHRTFHAEPYERDPNHSSPKRGLRLPGRCERWTMTELTFRMGQYSQQGTQQLPLGICNDGQRHLQLVGSQ